MRNCEILKFNHDKSADNKQVYYYLFSKLQVIAWIFAINIFLYSWIKPSLKHIYSN